MNTERRSRTKRGILIALLFVLLIYIIGSTYARYTNTAELNGTLTVAKWAVKLNDTAMNTITSAKSVNITLDTNAYVADGKIAPARTGTFDVVLDPTGSEVAIDYIIECGTAVTGLTDSASKLSITGAKYWIGEVTGDGTSVTVDTNSTAVKVFEDLTNVTANKPVTVKVTVEWDNANDTLSEHDTANGLTPTTVTVPVTVTAQQHIAADDNP